MTLEEWAELLRGAATRVLPALEQVVEETVIYAAVLAKGKIGVQQEDWAPLAASTIADKRTLGFSGPYYSPLLREGEMQDSISFETNYLTGLMGSDDKVAYWQEFGTSKMPPRPFIGPAMREASAVVGYTGIETIASTLMEPE